MNEDVVTESPPVIERLARASPEVLLDQQEFVSNFDDFTGTGLTRSLRVLDLHAFLSEPIPRRELILSPWLYSQSLSMIHAWRGIGKTYVALNVAYAVASGTSFLGWRAERARRVLYLDGEMPAATLQDRLRALVQADTSMFDPSYLRILTPDLQSGPMPDLATREGQSEIERIVQDAELIVVDNISTLVRDSGRENDAESWNDVGTWALKMRQRRRSILFLHHSGKKGNQRGSSKKEDTLDTVICLKRPPDYSEDQGARFQVHFEKSRNAGGEELRPVEAALSESDSGKAVWTYRQVEDSNFDRVVALANDGMRQGEIATELGLSKSSISRYLKRAREQGQLKGER